LHIGSLSGSDARSHMTVLKDIMHLYMQDTNIATATQPTDIETGLRNSRQLNLIILRKLLFFYMD